MSSDELNVTQQRLILASASSARAEMFRSAGIPFDVDAARIDEDLIKSSMLAEEFPPRDVADALAEAKARRVSMRRPACHVLAADQILVFEGKIFDKPKTLDEAKAHLRELRGQSHRLITAAIIMKDGIVSFRHIQIAKLTMRNFSDAFLDDYIASEGEQILACVGAYRLEGLGSQLFRQVEGDYFTILGLPLLPCLEHLRDQGILKT